MAKPLVIVESPTKARTIAGYLGPDFVVESSLGNIRDLPRNAAEIPARYKGQDWAPLGVDVSNDFEPVYVVPQEKKAQVRKLKTLLADASVLFLATDEDREGEAIAWHLAEELKPGVPVRRMVFDEITRAAILRAVEQPRDLDLQLVAAQETRRILDRLYGYEVSPVLWKKVLPGLSAGRVQSVFVRIIVERELERIAFREASWWDVEGTFAPADRSDETFAGTLVALDGKRLATGKDFSSQGRLTRDELVLLDEAQASALAADLADAAFSVRSVEEKPYRLSPHAPFMTSTLQQEAGRKLGFNVGRTMQAAQRLYENGYITYMRTDSTTLSETAVTAARDLARELYGPDYVPDRPREYKRKSRNAQEAHEAIRPSGDRFRSTEQVEREVERDEARLYDLIWKRTVASQMADARGQSVQVRLGAIAAGRDAEFATSGRTIEFPGFLRAYVEGSDDPEADLEDRQRILPRLGEGDALVASSLQPAGHTTKPPARLTEPALVKVVEEMGVGRPSTYASMVSTIQDRGYVWRKGQALVPSWTAFAVVALLKRYFPDLVDYEFTARMEDTLDEISNGREEPKPWLQRFYHGNGQPGLKDLVSKRLDEIDAREINSIRIGEAPDGEPVVVRVGRYGPYVQHLDDTASIPDDLPPDEVDVPKALELIELQAKAERPLGEDPETGHPIYVRAGRYGPYVQLGPLDDPQKTASLLRTMEPQSVTVDEALRLLSLPRTVGEHPEGGAIEALNGRYGPYLRWQNQTRSLEIEEQIFSVTLDEALSLLAQPKQRGRRREVPTLRELGEDPDTKRPIALKEGRYGPYVTDGETNASLQRDDDPGSVTLERASQLLAERRAKGPATRRKATTRKRKTTPAKKTTAKRKPSSKKTTRKRKAEGS